MMKIQMVDAKSPEAPQQFSKSFEETGFAVIRNHSIPWDLVQAVFDDWAIFFRSETKSKYTFDPLKQEGYFPFRSENAKDSTIKDLKEFFHLYGRGSLPTEVPERTWTLFKHMSQLGQMLLGWLDQELPQAIRANLSEPLQKMSMDSRETLLRPIHYPPLAGNEELGAIRAAAHEDINLITLLPAATAPGLQVKDLTGKWIDVPCDPECLVINAGDMLQMATHGFYRSTTHQVVNPPGATAGIPRYSMPLFIHPRPEVVLKPGTTAKDYLHERLAEIGLKKK